MKELNPKHREIVNRIASGETQVEIRDAMGLTKGSLSGAIFTLRAKGHIPPTERKTKMKKQMIPAHKKVYDLLTAGKRQVDIAKTLKQTPAQIAGITNRLRINGHIPKATKKGGRKLVSKNVKTNNTPIQKTQPKITQVVVEQPATEKYVVIVGSNLKEILTCLS